MAKNEAFSIEFLETLLNCATYDIFKANIQCNWKFLLFIKMSVIEIIEHGIFSFF